MVIRIIAFHNHVIFLIEKKDSERGGCLKNVNTASHLCIGNLTFYNIRNSQSFKRIRNGDAIATKKPVCNLQ